MKSKTTLIGNNIIVCTDKVMSNDIRGNVHVDIGWFKTMCTDLIQLPNTATVLKISLFFF